MTTSTNPRRDLIWYRIETADPALHSCSACRMTSTVSGLMSWNSEVPTTNRSRQLSAKSKLECGRTHFLRQEAKDVLNGRSAAQDHPLGRELRPELGISQSTGLSEFVPGHFVDFSRSTDENDALATLPRFDYRTRRQRAD